jgi:conjugal transfer pilus assembly protein TraB
MNTPTTSPPPSGPILTQGALQTRAFVKVLVGLVVLVLILGGGLFWLDTRKAAQEDRKANTRQHVILRPKTEQEDWRVKEGSRVEELNRTIQNLQREIKILRENDQRAAEKGAGSPAPRGRARTDGTTVPPPPPLDRILPPPDGSQPQPASSMGQKRPATVTPAQPDGGATVPTPPSRHAPSPASPRPAPASPGESEEGGQSQLPRAPGGSGSPGGKGGSDARSGLPGGDTGKLRVITPRSLLRNQTLPAEKVGWLPSGAIIPARLLTGVDASTAAGQQMPYPVLIRLTDSAILPNDLRMNLESCVVMGAAVGDLATERVSIRTEGLSCLLKRAGGLVTIDGDFKANVIGEDGRLGIRGRVVQKEGQLIARTMVAGFLSGVSEAFRPRISYAPMQLGGSDVTNNQSFSPPPMQDALLAAGLSGVGKATDILARYYLSLAEKTMPVIEIPSGINVDVVVLKGLPLRWRASAATEQVSDVIE